MPEVLFQELAADVPIMIWRAGPDKRSNWFNHLWLDFAGRDIEDEKGFGWTERIHADDRERVMTKRSAAFDERQKLRMTYRLRGHDGVYRWLLETAAPYFKNALFAGYFGTCVDITEQREAHDLAIKALAERDVLLREVYHRVKNNLQQIIGLITIESVAIADPVACRVLDALAGRVRAMGTVHQRLIASGSLAELSVRDFLSDLCKDIARGGGADRRDVVVTVDVDGSNLDIDRAIVLGLLVNEIITNAFKHAFPNEGRGKVDVSYRADAGVIVLEVADNGIGLPVSARETTAGHGSGLHLIDGFIDQLDGRLEIDRSAGTRMRVVFDQ